MGYFVQVHNNKHVHIVMIIPVLLSVIVVFEIVPDPMIDSVLQEMLGVSSLLVLGVRAMAFLSHV